jgi:hypothetical protein
MEDKNDSQRPSFPDQAMLGRSDLHPSGWDTNHGRGTDGDKVVVQPSYLVQTTLPVKDCQLTVAASPAKAETYYYWPLAFGAFTLIIAVLLWHVTKRVSEAIEKMRKMAVDTELAKLALREAGPAVDRVAIVHSHCQAIVSALKTSAAAPDLVKACRDFLSTHSV